jgi:adenylate kinase family enzyme
VTTPSPSLAAPLTRLAVLGPIGAGKTTLAGRLGSRLSIRRVSLDELFWGPGWTPVSEDVFSARLEEALAAPTWVTEGAYQGPVAEQMCARATLVIWLDLPLATCLRRVAVRTVRRVVRREPLWNGNVETWRRVLRGDSILLEAVRKHRLIGRSFESLLGAGRSGPPTVVRLRTVREVDAFVRAVEGRVGVSSAQGGEPG